MAITWKRLTTYTLMMPIVGFAASLQAGSVQAKTVQALTEPPNIILILADDMGWSDIGAYGGEIATPHLDQLAHDGIRFTQVHNTAKCFPSRASLLTGDYAQNVGMGRRPATLNEDAVTVAEVLREAGYRTLMAGKHHGKENPVTRGFDRYFGLRDGATNHFNLGHPRPDEPAPAQKIPGKRFWCIDTQCLQPYTPEDRSFYSTDAYTDKAIEYLEEYGPDNTPMFLYLSYQASHDPLQAWPEDIAKYQGKYMDGYAAVRQARYDRLIEMQVIDDAYPLPVASHRKWGALSGEKRIEADLRMAVYAAMIDRMDQKIGRLLATLKALGELDNTLVLFAADNGSSAEVVEFGSGDIGTITRWASLGTDWANVSNTPLRFYKNHSYQGGISTPLIAHWPDGIQRPSLFLNSPGISSISCPLLRS